MSGGGGPCFDLSGFFALPQSTQFLYRDYWNTFNRIQAYNIGVSTIRSGGDKTQTYYQYASGDERMSYINGQMLHIRRYPNSNWASVSPD
jgi:hypothetical protein